MLNMIFFSFIFFFNLFTVVLRGRPAIRRGKANTFFFFFFFFFPRFIFLLFSPNFRCFLFLFFPHRIFTFFLWSTFYWVSGLRDWATVKKTDFFIRIAMFDWTVKLKGWRFVVPIYRPVFPHFGNPLVRGFII